MSPAPESIAIVGAGLTGAVAAQTLREEGFDGRLVLVGEEQERPYERPPLSKEYLRGESPEPPFVHGEGFYSEKEIELITGTQVERIEAADHQLVLADNEPLGYDTLLLCTGARPRRLDVPGSELGGIHYLRNLCDSRELGRRLEGGGRVVVVGSGWIGAEVAASARQKGCEVTMIEMASLPLERVLGAEVGRLYLDIHRSHGVDFLPETTVERFEGTGDVERVLTSDGAMIDADFVVVAIGVDPASELAQNAGIPTDNGILVDERLATAAPGVFAAGDVANAYHPFFERRLRVEHWANARAQGAAAARSMLGTAISYDEIPYFFSDQYEVGMEYGGFATSWDQVVLRGDPQEGQFVAFWLDDQRVVAGMNVNVWDVNEAIRDLVRSRAQVAVDALVDPAAAIEELASASASDR